MSLRDSLLALLVMAIWGLNFVVAKWGLAEFPPLFIMALRFIAVAARAGGPGGRLLLVANRHLPYEATLAQAFSGQRVLAEAGGFKVIEATRGASR